MWEWLLDNYKHKGIFRELASGLVLEKGIFHIPELVELLLSTLTKNDGGLDWEHGLIEVLPQFAVEAPEQTLEITRLYLLEGSVRNQANRSRFVLDEVWKETFAILHQNLLTQVKTIKLISDLVLEGGSFFWPLKEVLKK